MLFWAIIVRIFLQGYLYAVTWHLLTRRNFLFLDSQKGFWRSLTETSQYFHFVDNSNHLKDLVIRILWTWRCPSLTLRRWYFRLFLRFIRPNNFKDTIWWLQNTKLLSRRYHLNEHAYNAAHLDCNCFLYYIWTSIQFTMQQRWHFPIWLKRKAMCKRNAT